jgi:hypothetical protein
MRIDLVALVALTACSPGKGADGSPSAVAATVSEKIPTVVTVTWSTPTAEKGHVEFGVDGAFDRSTPDETSAATAHSAVLIGLPQNASVSFRVVSEGGTSGDQDVGTGQLVDRIPEPIVTGAGANDQFLTTVLLGDTSRIAVFDPKGRLTWSYEDQRGLSVYRARPLRDGTGIVYSSTLENGQPSPNSAFVKVSWDGSTVDVIPSPVLAHDFVELPDGTLVSLAYETRPDAVDPTVDVEGNQLTAAAADGTISSIWSAWDCLDPIEDPTNDPGHGWTHTNALDYDPVADAFTVGVRNLGTLERVDRATGTCPWGFGGIGGTVALTGDRFVHEHQFEQIPGGMLVFDNANTNTGSRVIEYSFDEAALTAQSERTFTTTDSPPLYTFIMGDVHRVADGETLIAWGEGHIITRMGADGLEKWRLDTGTDDLLGFVTFASDLYVVE